MINATNFIKRRVLFGAGLALSGAAVTTGSSTGESATAASSTGETATAASGATVVSIKSAPTVPSPTAAPYDVDPTGVRDSAPAFARWLADLRDAQQDGVIPTGTYRLDSGINWDSTMGSVSGQGNVTLDFSQMTQGVALSITGRARAADSFAHRGTLHFFERIRLLGPDNDATSVDGIFVSDTTGADMVVVANCMTYGFRDALTVGTNNWLLKFRDCSFGHFHRYGANLSPLTNAGENYQFYGCAFYSSTNSAKNATAVSTQGNLEASFFACSFDYNDIEVDHRSGVLGFHGCHFENSSRPSAMIYLSSSPRMAHTSLRMFGGTISQTEKGVGRTHLVELRTGSTSQVYLTLCAIDVKSWHKETKFFENLSHGTSPTVTYPGGVDIGGISH